MVIFFQRMHDKPKKDLITAAAAAAAAIATGGF